MECFECGQEYESKEYVEFKPTTQKARKDYQCFACKLTINKGEVYIRQSGIDYHLDSHFTVQMHQKCPSKKKMLIEALESVLNNEKDAISKAKEVLEEVKKSLIF